MSEDTTDSQTAAFWYARHRCANCKKAQSEHEEGKCLFEATLWRPMCVDEYALWRKIVWETM